MTENVCGGLTVLFVARRDGGIHIEPDYRPSRDSQATLGLTAAWPA